MSYSLSVETSSQQPSIAILTRLSYNKYYWCCSNTRLELAFAIPEGGGAYGVCRVGMCVSVRHTCLGCYIYPMPNLSRLCGYIKCRLALKTYNPHTHFEGSKRHRARGQRTSTASGVAPQDPCPSEIGDLMCSWSRFCVSW